MKKLKKLVIALLVLTMAIPSLTNSSSAREYTVTQNMTEWNIYLYEHQDLINVYNELFDARDAEGNRLYSDEFVMGIIANVEHEGAPGIVEYYFSLPLLPWRSGALCQSTYSPSEAPRRSRPRLCFRLQYA